MCYSVASSIVDAASFAMNRTNAKSSYRFIGMLAKLAIDATSFTI